MVIVAVVTITMYGVTSAYADLEDVRASVITSGVIPDTYLIQPTGTYWNANGGTLIKNALQQWMDGNNMTIASDRFQNSVNRALYNVDILLEGRVDSKHEVTAMLVAKERLQGTYSETGYLKKYHDYIIGEYSQPSTVTAIETKLNSTLGDMAPLARAIKTVTDKAASIARVPTGLQTSDPETSSQLRDGRTTHQLGKVQVCGRSAELYSNRRTDLTRKGSGPDEYYQLQTFGDIGILFFLVQIHQRILL